MIFQHTWQQVLDGTKTQTRRLVKPGEELETYWSDRQNCMITQVSTSPGRVKWRVGNTYTVVPKRGHPAIWIGVDGTPFDSPMAEYLQKADGVDAIRATWGKMVKAWLRDHGYREARIRITGIRSERLQDITEEDAEAEGVGAISFEVDYEEYQSYVYAYEELWSDIHTAPGTTWADNPEVWVLEFELARGACKGERPY